MLTNVLIALIRVYQRTLSRLLLAAFGPVCRFEPSCSRYAIACLEGHGAARGGLLSIVRLCKCHPFHPGGFDPPPPAARRTSPPGAPSPGAA
jgi:putative membrane protein insertion efficiency factor